MASSPGTTATASRPASAQVLDFAIPAVILLSVMVVLAPVPAPVVDLLLAANLTVSVVALPLALDARTPLELSVFPTFLLGATLVRLVLNIATTRLVLSRAAVDGAGAAGQVVLAFGEFVAANNIVVGAVIFAIIAVIQFAVITAGATRTSEVAARFSLDGLPGRQMAIDTEVQSGTISRDQARHLRLELQRQADFFASMDGASRFVRGEAVASVIITVVNIVGGLAIGVLEHGMPVAKAVEVYSVAVHLGGHRPAHLTVQPGRRPAAGTRAAVRGSAPRARHHRRISGALVADGSALPAAGRDERGGRCRGLGARPFVRPADRRRPFGGRPPGRSRLRGCPVALGP